MTQTVSLAADSEKAMKYFKLTLLTVGLFFVAIPAFVSFFLFLKFFIIQQPWTEIFIVGAVCGACVHSTIIYINLIKRVLCE